MASLANDMRVQGKPAKAPLATHPAFPFIVALWFAALLGLGSLVVPVPLIEQISVATGIASIVPAAAPPLGFTARALMALAFTFGGAMAGLLIARQVAKAHRDEPAARTVAAATTTDRKPIFAHAELGDEGLDGRSFTPRGRRALAIDNEERPSDFLELAPMPGHARDTGLSNFSQVPAAEPQAAEDELELTELDLTAFEATEFDGAEFPMSHDHAGAAETATPGFSTFATNTGNDTMDDRQFFQRSPDANPERQEFRYSVEPATQTSRAAAPAVALTMTNAWSDIEEEDGDDYGDETPAVPADALQFSPPSLARQLFVSDSEDAAFGDGDAAPEDHSQFAAAASFNEPAPHAATIAPDSEMDDLGLVQLAQRLGASIEKRRELLAARAELLAAAAAVPVVTAAPVLAEDFDLAAPDEAAEAMAAYFSRPQAAEAQALAGEEDAADAADEDETASSDPHAIAPIAPRSTLHSGPRQVFEPFSAPADETAHRLHPLAGLARIDIDEDDEEEDIDDLAASFSLPLGRLTAAAAWPADDTAESVEADEAPAPQAVFHARQEFVRIEDEPEVAEDDAQHAVVFPVEAAAPAPAFGQVPVDTGPKPVFESEAYQTQARIHTEEHERALRDALLNLQRMSGAA